MFVICQSRDLEILVSSMSAIEGEYIVVLKDTLTSQEGEFCQTKVRAVTVNCTCRPYDRLVSDHIAWARQQVAQSGHGSTIMDVFSMGTFNGYSAKLAPQ